MSLNRDLYALKFRANYHFDRLNNRENSTFNHCERLEMCSLLMSFVLLSVLLRPTDEEAEQLLQLMTSRPPATPAGVRFVSLSFCMLLAFSTLVRYSQCRRSFVTSHWFSPVKAMPFPELHRAFLSPNSL